MLSSTMFREYDIRGLVDTDLTDENVSLIGKSIGTYFLSQGRKRIVVGRDVRPSSVRISEILCTALSECGIEVIDVGLVPTPVQYFAILFLSTDGGVMVTGSHNPKEYNGLKMSVRNRDADGKAWLGAIWGVEIQRLLEILDKRIFSSGKGSIQFSDVIPSYMKEIMKRISLNRKLKIVIDAGNGCGGLFAPKIFESMGCEVICLYCDIDGNFPNHIPDPTVPKNMIDLRKKVVTEQADLGIGYDGDADRIGVVDNLGRMIFADKLLALFAREILQRIRGAKIVFDVKCSQALPEFIESCGGVGVMSKTGHSIVKMKMNEENAPLAGEMSGHIYFGDEYYGYDDAIYSTARFLRLLSLSNKTSAALHDEIPKYVSTPEIRVDTTEEDKFRIVNDLVAYFKKKYKVIDIDGARVLFENGWGLVRVSNTQPALVMRFEARTEIQLNEIMAIFKKQLQNYPSVKIIESDFRMAT